MSMIEKIVNCFTIDELLKLNQNACNKIVKETQVRTQEFLTNDFCVLYQKLRTILEENYYSVNLEPHYKKNNKYSYRCGTVHYKGGYDCDAFQVIEAIKKELDYNSYPSIFIHIYLTIYELNTTNLNNAENYLTNLFDFLFKQENIICDIDSVTEYISSSNKLFTAYGVDTDTLLI